MIDFEGHLLMTDRRTGNRTDIGDYKVAFVTEKFTWNGDLTVMSG